MCEDEERSWPSANQEERPEKKQAEDTLILDIQCPKL